MRSDRRTRRLAGRVAVITGASSGLGRATAIELARRGATVFLAARRADALEDTARRCRDVGGEARAVVTDVTREDDVRRLAEAARAHAGRLDLWINNAAVTLFARLEDAPLADHQRVLDTNLLGAILGARAAVPIFRSQRHGVLINVSSLLGKVGQPFVPSYVISKFGMRGLSEALRADLADEPDVHVCTIFPYAIDTPHFETAGNYLGRPAYAMPPAQPPEKVARAIADLAERPRRERHVPRAIALLLAVRAVFPRLTERLLRRGLARWHLGPGAAAPTAGNLYEPAGGPAHVHGTRPPRVGAPTVAAWAAREGVAIQLEAAGRTVRRWLGRRAAPSREAT